MNNKNTYIVSHWKDKNYKMTDEVEANSMEEALSLVKAFVTFIDKPENYSWLIRRKET